MQQLRAAILPHTVPGPMECGLRPAALEVRLEGLEQFFHLSATFGDNPMPGHLHPCDWMQLAAKARPTVGCLTAPLVLFPRRALPLSALDRSRGLLDRIALSGHHIPQNS